MAGDLRFSMQQPDQRFNTLYREVLRLRKLFKEGSDGGGTIQIVKVGGIALPIDQEDKSVNIDPIQGPAGPAGAKGDKGDKGDTGAQGIAGTQGIQGIQGPKGDTGAQGTAGTNGLAGPKGDKGDKGDTGSQGPIGNTGLQGPIGPEGPEGPQGPPGETKVITGEELIAIVTGMTEEEKERLRTALGVV